MDKRIYYRTDSKKFGWDKPRKNRNARFGYAHDKDFRKEERKLIRAVKHKLFLEGRDISEIYEEDLRLCTTNLEKYFMNRYGTTFKKRERDI